MARTFNGTTDVINLVAGPVTVYPMTFAAWFKKSALPASFSPVIELDTNGADLGLNSMYLSPTGDLVAYSQSAAGTGASAVKGTYTVGTWFHAVALYSNQALRNSYLNGIAGTVNTGAITIPTFTRLSVTRAAGAADNTSGAIAEVGIWNVELTDIEIALLAKGFCPRLIRPASLKTYIPIIRNTQNYNIGPMTVTGTTVSDHPRIFY